MSTTTDTATGGTLLTPSEAAKALRVSPRTVYLWIASGKLHAIHVSERVTRIPAGEIDRLLGTGREEAPAVDLSSVLWDVDIARIDTDAHARLIIERILESGRPAQVRWMFQRYSIEHVLDVARNSRGLSHRASVAWTTLLEDRHNHAA